MSAIYDFTIEQYATFTRQFTVTDPVSGLPIDLTSFAGLMQFRDTSNVVLFSLSTTDGRITLGNGTIDLLISALDTGTLTFAKAVHDLVITGGTPLKSTRYFQGKVKLSTGVSHA